MAKRGPKSASELAGNVIPIGLASSRPRPAPPSSLPKNMHARFNSIAMNHPHLRPGDDELLAAYVRSLHKADMVAKSDSVAALEMFEKMMRVSLALARSLRLTAISIHQVTAGRKHANALPPSLLETNPELFE